MKATNPAGYSDNGRHADVEAHSLPRVSRSDVGARIDAVGSRVVQVDAGLVRIEQRMRIAGPAIGTDVSGPACIVASVRVARGEVDYLCGRTQVTAPAAFDLVLPPCAIVQVRLERTDATSIAVAFRPGRGDRVPRHALLLPAAADRPLRTVDDARARLGDVDDGVEIGRTADPRSLAARAKQIVDAHYAGRLEIGRLARRLHVTGPALSRAFRAAYGIPPVRYRHQVRIVDALVRLAEGSVPADVFQEVGFDDLSRFYKVFRTVACAAPGTYRPRTSRNAKT
jgi:AraC-like DNA-binding protein